MKKIPLYEKINGLKREIVMGDFFAIPHPIQANNFPENTVKVFTENIYIPDIGSYIVVVWDFQRNRPAILVLSHTLFAAMKRWRAEAMQDIIGKTFTIVSKSKQGVVYHDLYCRGLLPLVSADIVDVMDSYINELFNIEALEETEEISNNE